MEETALTIFQMPNRSGNYHDFSYLNRHFIKYLQGLPIAGYVSYAVKT